MDAALLEEFGLGDARERAESWRYSAQALRALGAQSFVAADAAATPPPALMERCDWAETRGRRLVFVNGRLSAAHSDWRALAQARPEVRIDSGPAGATVIVLPAGRTGLLHIVWASVPGAAPGRWNATCAIRLEGGTAHVIEQHLAAPGADVLGALGSELEVAAGAALHLTVLSDLPAAASLYRRVRATLRERGVLCTTHALGGGRLQRFDFACDLAQPEARCELRGVFAAQGREHIDAHLEVRHAARDTASDVLWRGVADGRGRGVLHGAIRVESGADGADARLQTKNLLLSPHAEIDAQPVLEIHADEVKASHGATVGRLDERALFYLRSRGVPERAARAMLIEGFCREAFAVLDDAALGARLDTWLATHVAAGGERRP